MTDAPDRTAAPTVPVRRRWLLPSIVALAIAAALAWWWRGSATTGDAATASNAPTPAASAASAAGGPPVSVSVVRAERRDVPVQLEATGTVTALNSVDVKPQVSSVITRVHIREGQFVKAGEPLFTLDARSDEAKLGQSQAQLQKDQASLADAQRQLARSKELFAQNFISQGAVDTAQALVETQQAVVAADRAAIEAARVAVSYSRIVAPGPGRAGQIVPVVGSYVQPSGAPLVTITQLDPIAVSFSLPQRNLADALAGLRDGGGSVTAVLPERGGSLNGRLQFVDNAVDASSGTVRVKAVFDNATQKLWPGAFVTVRLTVQTLKGAIVVPLAAIVQSPRAKVVFVVEPGNKVGVRPIEVVYATGNDAVVTGLAGGERVVLDGRQNVRPGSVVVERAADAASGARVKRAGAGASAPAGAAPGASSTSP
jgi:RND family efflux transporter MFP subunit